MSKGLRQNDTILVPLEFQTWTVIRDNYIYQNGRVGVSWSGMGDGKTVGSGTVDMIKKDMTITSL